MNTDTNIAILFCNISWYYTVVVLSKQELRSPVIDKTGDKNIYVRAAVFRKFVLRLFAVHYEKRLKYGRI